MDNISRAFVCFITAALLLVAGTAWGTTYYKSAKGTAANKGAATGPCTTAANCMSPAVYAGETFANGDIIIHCHTPVGIPGKIWSEAFVDSSQTIVLPASYILLVDGSSKFLLANGVDKLIRP